MDQLKLIKWKEDFEAKAKLLQIEYDAFFQNQKIEDAYSIHVDINHDWELKLITPLPHEIKESLEKIFWETKPEDSI